ncbi:MULTISPECIES: tRNA lysidine(34) synthetase TilS [unclassified Oleiphilus]|jgi:tRNA(Ile)-lysidine synthase|nr:MULTISPECIES: tRNA lysidine(34) synthetase TilS [unclassified Oleiphilus]KZY80611.1 hypothetical protein A3741_05355 [Oleiphilus sp. HI0069]KZY83754.1 hypothetical protein A3740_00610 [Oleiphilus sp. HI0068]KZY87323.1 hypothetical protein A3743_14845 [Oleiphilus sp. HI0072]KZY31378.1 hypothetical protein A3729_09225 [Oleiphilus sp. HI0043]KZY56367.1 hypothetical protein A3735_04605 [Oleiphilus sp. HI0061]
MKVSPVILQALKRVPESKRYVVALSGGLDSIVLLHTFRLLNPSLALSAIHVHHGLSKNADDWARHCQQVCQELSIPCYVERVSVTASGEGLEAAARKARYEVFERLLNDGDVLLQGHHQNDQAETVLIRALRGSGVKGLSAIPPSRLMSCGTVIYRPLLEVSRRALELEAEGLGLKWVEDESNSDSVFDRNFLRNEILPLLEQRWPNSTEALAQVACKASETQSFIDDWCVKQFDSGLLLERAQGEKVIDISVLSSYRERDQKILLRAWIDNFDCPQPSERILGRVFTELISAKPDANPIVQWSGFELRRYLGGIYCQRKPVGGSESYSETRQFKRRGQVYNVEIAAQNISCAYESGDVSMQADSGRIQLAVPGAGFELQIKSRAGGESLRTRPDGPGRSLKSLFQEAGIPPWRRDTYPLIYIDGVLAAIGNLWIGAGFHAESGLPVLSVYFNNKY